MDDATLTDRNCKMASEKKVQASREGLASLTVWIDPEVRKGLKKAAVEYEVTVQELIEAMIVDALPNSGRIARKIKQQRETS